MADNLVPHTTETLDLGTSDKKWKDIYLSGSVTDGTNAASASDIKTAVDAVHDRAHDLDSSSDHNGLSGGTSGDIIVSDGDGLPSLSGVFIGDLSPKWNLISAINTTAPQTYSFTITGEDWTAILLPGTSLKLKSDGAYIYGMVSACAFSTNTTVTVAGVNLATGAGLLTEAYYGPPVETVEFMVEGNWAAATEADLLRDVAKTPVKWNSSKAYLVGISASQEIVDTGAEGKLNVEINGAAVSTNDSNNGIQLGAANTWVDSWSASSTGALSSSNYDINFGEELELSCTAAGGTGDGRNLVAILSFVRP